MKELKETGKWTPEKERTFEDLKYKYLNKDAYNQFDYKNVKANVLRTEIGEEDV